MELIMYLKNYESEVGMKVKIKKNIFACEL